MIVSIDERYAPALRDPRDFKGFMLAVDLPISARASVSRALADIGGALEGEHAWISAEWLRRQPGLAEDADWQRGLQGMLEYATRKGWVDEARGLVRAHIEWRSVSTAGK